MLPPGLKQRAVVQAHTQGVSFGEFVRRALEKAVAENGSRSVSGRDTFWSDKAVFRGQAPKDIARRHDDYLYGAE
jgi:hypothetical protein